MVSSLPKDPAIQAVFPYKCYSENMSYNLKMAPYNYRSMSRCELSHHQSILKKPLIATNHTTDH
jgi:hypothetical protein